MLGCGRRIWPMSGRLSPPFCGSHLPRHDSVVQPAHDLGQATLTAQRRDGHRFRPRFLACFTLFSTWT